MSHAAFQASLINVMETPFLQPSPSKGAGGLGSRELCQFKSV